MRHFDESVEETTRGRNDFSDDERGPKIVELPVLFRLMTATPPWELRLRSSLSSLKRLDLHHNSKHR